MNQIELRKMAEERIKDAKVLIDGQRWEFAYYAAGYAVECALKSCILSRMVLTAWVFKEKWDYKECFEHRLEKLIHLAGLTDELNEKIKGSAAAGKEFVNNWTVTAKWTVTSRYESKTESEAKELLLAISDENHGVLSWIKNFW